MLVYYYGIKMAFFFGLVQAYVKYEPLQRSWLFLSLLYTAGVAFISWVFLIAPMATVDWRQWEFWLLKTLVLMAVYLRLLRRFDEGAMFWVLLAAGVAVVLY